MPETLGATASAGIDVALPNGLRFAGERLERSQGVALAIRIPAGSKDDPANKLGLARLTKESMFKGTRRRTARELSDAFDFYGIRHSESTGTESTTLQLRFLPEHLDAAFKLLREILGEPSFPASECETAKTQALQELAHLDDDPMTKVFVILKELYFGSAWGHSELGTEASVPELTRGDIQGFWRAHYIPAGTVVSATGKFDPDTMLKHVETLFLNSGEGWPQENPPPPPATRTARHAAKDTEQTQIALAFPCVPRKDPSYYAGRMAVGVLSGGMSGRLFTEVREKRSLVYSVGAQMFSFRTGGVIYAYAGTTALRAAETLKVLKAELANLPNGLTEEELSRARAGYKAHLLMDQESTGSRARQLLDDVYYENRIVPLSEVLGKLDAVRVEDVQRYWHSHPVDPCALVTLGRDALE